MAYKSLLLFSLVILSTTELIQSDGTETIHETRIVSKIIPKNNDESTVGEKIIETVEQKETNTENMSEEDMDKKCLFSGKCGSGGSNGQSQSQSINMNGQFGANQMQMGQMQSQSINFG